MTVDDADHTWAERAATLVLLWSELADDTPPAEACATWADLIQRRDTTRRDLRRFLEMNGRIAAPDKWVGRTLWSHPPRRGFLDAQHKDVMVEWVLHTGLNREARVAVERAVRALFVDGAEEDAALHRERPHLRAAVRRLLDAQAAPPLTAELERATRLLLADTHLPMYLTDGDLQRVVWTNRSLQAFIGLSADRLRGMPFTELVSLALMLVEDDERAAYVAAQRRVIDAGQVTGRGFIEARVHLDRRTWVHDQPTPPWSGSWWLTAHAHFILDPTTERRLGSLAIWSLRAA